VRLQRSLAFIRQCFPPHTNPSTRASPVAGPGNGPTARAAAFLGAQLERDEGRYHSERDEESADSLLAAAGAHGKLGTPPRADHKPPQDAGNDHISHGPMMRPDHCGPTASCR
ncbi:MAG: hypothetical protein QOI85_1535, partial [Chloroflexota bacterium]|nr:hypothetical protein [Chloroflexota bacterium]